MEEWFICTLFGHIWVQYRTKISPDDWVRWQTYKMWWIQHPFNERWCRLVPKQCKTYICGNQWYGLVEYWHNLNQILMRLLFKIPFYRCHFLIQPYRSKSYMFGVLQSAMLRTDNIECKAPTIFGVCDPSNALLRSTDCPIHRQMSPATLQITDIEKRKQSIGKIERD